MFAAYAYSKYCLLRQARLCLSCRPEICIGLKCDIREISGHNPSGAGARAFAHPARPLKRGPRAPQLSESVRTEGRAEQLASAVEVPRPAPPGDPPPHAHHAHKCLWLPLFRAPRAVSDAGNQRHASHRGKRPESPVSDSESFATYGADAQRPGPHPL